MTTLKEFPIYKKRDGQDYKYDGYIYIDTFENAKIEFANDCYNALLEGYHGDDWMELTAEEDGVDEDGVYYNNGQPYNELDCFFPKSDLVQGIEVFREDVYTWKLTDLEK